MGQKFTKWRFPLINDILPNTVLISLDADFEGLFLQEQWRNIVMLQQWKWREIEADLWG